MFGGPERKTVDNVFSHQSGYSPYVGRNFQTFPFFEDPHLHTSLSMTARALSARLTPADAYRFARGEEVIASMGQGTKLPRPRLRQRSRGQTVDCYNSALNLATCNSLASH
ncbi:DUF3604 domain-containing protein [Haliea alexandrii]|uniref:DUF3604 domain-containing protein n=1 Tax=Haliea alexandrii TaxID=2448162 RepID=UPI000F0B9AB7